MKNYTITIQADTCDEFKNQILAAAKMVGAELLSFAPQAANAVSPQLELPLTQISATPEKKKPGRPRKDAVAQTTAASPVANEDDAPEEKSEISVSDLKAVIPTFVDVKTALKKVAEAISLEKAQELVKQYGADRVSALKEQDYRQFIKACDLALVN